MTSEKYTKFRRSVIVINSKDNVAVALRDLKPGEIVEVSIGDKLVKVQVRDFIKRGHKIALYDLRKGDYIIKYGEVIGVATQDIKQGQHVHCHNVKSARI